MYTTCGQVMASVRWCRSEAKATAFSDKILPFLYRGEYDLEEESAAIHQVQATPELPKEEGFVHSCHHLEQLSLWMLRSQRELVRTSAFLRQYHHFYCLGI